MICWLHGSGISGDGGIILAIFAVTPLLVVLLLSSESSSLHVAPQHGAVLI